MIKKRNFQTKQYEEYKPPVEESKLLLYTDNIDLIVYCAGCGKKIRYGDTYTSRTIHNEIGLGYPVCEECYEKEIKLEKIYK